ncbi:MAG: DUF1800 domain-containing protein [Alicyclobacillus macrosporangiidus]|uniref:DUF1800 domain-containing protein n=1 Tax=Alicyclobacillus macrosporangiidus TaxID=392015 RepID=UPI0026F14588|nr:DUF1800 domain-containing protein [Alicyclobacillus macrosporangiidus]MCL6601006.1 DUF1800 domain-containing protein [Alicyclobacillus macrosporangiidus]
MDDWIAAVHLNKRAGFGDSPAVIQQWIRQGYTASVDALFPSTLQDLQADVHPVGAESHQTRGEDFVRLREAWVDRMVKTANPFLEKMTLFWHNHFATAEYKVNSPALMLRQNNTLRRNALGSFRQMLLDVTADPAMLIWLDNAKSTKRAPNENYGRELMELFTIGLTYTQADVVAAARSLTGYQLDRKTGQVRFVPARHDDGVKTLLGKTGNWGPEQVVDILLEHPNCAPFVVTKLLRWFVHPDPPADWVRKFAQVFVQGGYHIGHLMKAIFLSDEFLSTQAVGSLIKTPADYVIRLVRMTGLSVPARQLDAVMTQCGMQLFNPPNVGGWPGGRNWLSSATMLARFNFAYQLARRTGAVVTAPGTGDGATEDTIQRLLKEAGVTQPSASTVQALRDYAGKEAPGAGGQLVQQLRYLVWISPEFQMC